jgi:hypothetical protein
VNHCAEQENANQAKAIEALKADVQEAFADLVNQETGPGFINTN